MAKLPQIPYSSDTSDEALAVQLAGLRTMSPRERIRQTCVMSRRLRDMALNAIRRRHPGWGESEVRLNFIELTYGKALADAIRHPGRGANALSTSDVLIDALMPVVAALRHLGVRHYVVGSIASSFHGATRSTMDVDLVAELSEEKISDFIGRVGDEFYVSETAARDAVRRSCFNLIHLPSSFKVDVFVSLGRPFDRESMGRATLEQLGESRSIQVPVATAEDTVISKLERFRLTNETSERQWDDVSKLIRLLGEAADLAYLQRAAESVGVDDLLQRLLSQSGD